MLSAKHLKGLRMRATDDDIGKIADVLFDDETWTVRYVVVETGSWLSRHPVLISPIALRSIDALEVPIQADLTADEIRNSPHIDLDSPVSRRQERHYHQHYGWPYYWWGGGLWGMYPYPTDLRFRRSSDPSIDPATDLPHDPPTDAGAHGSDAGDPHLRSAHEVIGYDIEATDHGVGTVEDLLIDGRSWAIRYTVVDTSKWWIGRKVLVAPDWIDAISWRDMAVRVALTRDAVKAAPRWVPSAPPERRYEEELFAHYRKDPYWRSTTDARRTLSGRRRGE